MSPIDWLAKEWSERLASSVELMTEARPALKLGARVSAGAAEVPPAALWISIGLDVGEHTTVFIGAAEESWRKIGSSTLLAAGVTEGGGEDAHGAYLELVTHATAGFAQAIGARLGRPAASLPAEDAPLSEQDLREVGRLTPVEMSLRESPLGKLYLGWNQALESALESADPSDAEPDCARAAGTKPPGPETSKTFDLLMEVELPVSVSFGRAQLPLRDVLKLNSGSIIELNRTITDPVEIIVNNCVIARGEVVVVEGNYGVRIQHVISREERLRTLK